MAADLNNDGAITEAELKLASSPNGEKISDSEVKKAFDLYDINKDGKISWYEMEFTHNG